MITIPDDIVIAIEHWAPSLKIPAGSALLQKPTLGAICGNESKFGSDHWRWKPRHEDSYDRNGAYYNENRFRVEKYGFLAASSWGWGQIMYPTACELGFTGHPWELMDAMVCAEWLVAYLNKRTFVQWDSAPQIRLIEPALTIEQVGDSFNTGSLKDRIRNLDYETEIHENYDLALEFFHG